MTLRVSHVSLQQHTGGAAIATLRIHRALRAHGEGLGVDSHLRARYGSGGDPSIEVGPPLGSNPFWLRLQPRLTALARRGFMPAYPITHSTAWPSTGLGRELSRSDSDLIHLHWLGDQILSIEEIGSLPQPLVWTLHDQWAFCGAEHYTSPPLPGETASSDERFAAGYSRASRRAHEAGPAGLIRSYPEACG
ncbi:MAG: glycosyltransferase [Cyanobacteria bacterium]|nr:glycosyltransferase [Cyanobacteriota bacterium]